MTIKERELISTLKSALDEVYSYMYNSMPLPNSVCGEVLHALREYDEVFGNSEYIIQRTPIGLKLRRKK